MGATVGLYEEKLHPGEIGVRRLKGGDEMSGEGLLTCYAGVDMTIPILRETLKKRTFLFTSFCPEEEPLAFIGASVAIARL